MDGRTIKGQETKKKIIYATLHYISEHGLKNISASKIAKLAGVSKSNVFHHFESVDTLPIEAMKMIASELIALNNVDQIGSFRDLLTYIGDEIFMDDEDHVNFYRSFFVLYNEAFHDERYNAVIMDIKIAYGESLKDAIIALNGDIYEDLDDYCQLIAVVADGFGCHFLTDLNVNYYKELWAMQVDMLIDKLEKLKK